MRKLATAAATLVAAASVTACTLVGTAGPGQAATVPHYKVLPIPLYVSRLNAEDRETIDSNKMAAQLNRLAVQGYALVTPLDFNSGVAIYVHR